MPGLPEHESVDPQRLSIEGYSGFTEIGSGGFATVYRARREAFSQDVAIKLIRDSSVDEAARLRFERERAAMGMLAQHPHIVTVYDGGVSGQGWPYLVMEYLPGGSLSSRVGHVGWAEALDVGVKLCGALASAHRLGVLHRDVKPDNVLVSRYGEPLLADFGIARLAGSERTVTGVVTASLLYAPPEVLNGEAPTPASDVFSLGATLFALVHGAPPFAGADNSFPMLLGRVLRAAIPDLRGSGVPGPVCAAWESALAKQPAQRCGSAEEFAEVLRRAQRELGLRPTEPVLERVTGETGLPALTVDQSAAGGRPSGVYRGPDPAFEPGGRAPAPHPGPWSLPSGASAGPGEWRPPGPPPVDPTAYIGNGRTGGSRWLTVASVAMVLVAAGLVVFLVLNRSGGQSSGPIVEPTTGSAGSTSRSSVSGPSADGRDVTPLLLDFTDFAPGGGEVDPPDADLAAILNCPRPADVSGKMQEAKRQIAPGGPEGRSSSYQVAVWVASFRPGQAAAFMQSWRQTADACGRSSSIVDPPQPVTVFGAQDAVRITSQNRDAIWVRNGDYVAEVQIIASVGNADPAVVTEIAAKAAAKINNG